MIFGFAKRLLPQPTESLESQRLEGFFSFLVFPVFMSSSNRVLTDYIESALDMPFIIFFLLRGSTWLYRFAVIRTNILGGFEFGGQ